MDLEYYMKLQNAYGTKSNREKELAKTNREMSLHFSDTYDTETVLRNGNPMELMIIKDTDGNTFKKKIKSRHEDKFNLGDYVIWNNQYWLITLLDPDDKTWNRGYMFLCTVPLRWQNAEGEIIERLCYSEDFTKYSSGTKGNSTITVADNQYGLTIPMDEETKKLKRDMRFAIDFDDVDTPDVYALTNRKVKLNDNQYFRRGGTMILTMSFNAFDKDRDENIDIGNGHKIWICDYHASAPTPAPPDETTNLTATISGGSTIKCGRDKSWTAVFQDKDGNEVTDCDFKWNIISEFEVSQVIDGNKIQLRIDDEDQIGSSFLLQVIVADTVLYENEILVVANF